MHTETERKFLALRDQLPKLAMPEYPDVAQAYLCRSPMVRVRRTRRGGMTYVRMEVKGAGDIARSEFGPYKLPAEDFGPLAALSPWAVIEKERHVLPSGNAHPWELDVFHGANEGLMIAELELQREDERFERPLWVGAEVSRDARFASAALAERAFSTWPEAWRAAVLRGEVPPLV